MKRLMILPAAIVLLAGCGSEAKRFGYKGFDLDDEDKMFFSTGPGVTNWVPARVLCVSEDYPISAAESALVAAAGVVMPSEPLDKIPDGYKKGADEPWFAMWTKEAEHFGRKGVNGFVSHFNEDKNVWETGETYFSSYYGDEQSALAVLADMRKVVGKEFSSKRFHDFDKCWIAEYLRLRILCLVGQKPDGTWSCMLDIQDKSRPGCGQWEPLDAQEERLAEYKYRKALAAWKEANAKVLAANHAEVEKRRQEKGLKLFGESVKPTEAGDGRMAYVVNGVVEGDAAADRMAVWGARAAAVEAATGVVLTREPAVEEVPSGYAILGASAENELYDVRLDMAFLDQAAPSSDEEPKADEGDSERPAGEWRVVCRERLLPGFVPPVRPQPPQRQ